MNDAVNSEALDKSEIQEVESLPPELEGLAMPDTLPDASSNIIDWNKWALLTNPSSVGAGISFLTEIFKSANGNDYFILAIWNYKAKTISYKHTQLTSLYGKEISVSFGGFTVSAKSELKNTSTLDVEGSYSSSGGKPIPITKTYSIE